MQTLSFQSTYIAVVFCLYDFIWWSLYIIKYIIFIAPRRGGKGIAQWAKCTGTADSRRSLRHFEGTQNRGHVISICIDNWIKQHLFRFPLFVTVHEICKGELQPEKLIDKIRNHPRVRWMMSDELFHSLGHYLIKGISLIMQLLT